MYTNITFILYIIAILISFVCLVFIGLIFVHKNHRRNNTYIAARNFALVVMLTGLLYFVFYYREVVQENYELGVIFRIVDYLLCTLLFLCRFFVLENLLNRGNNDKVIKAAKMITVARLILSVLVTSVFMGEYYDIANADIRNIWSVTEVLFIMITAIMVIYCSIRILSESIGRLKKGYVTVCSFLLLFWSVWQGIIDLGLFMGKYGVSAWLFETPDFTGAAMFLLNLATCVFVFKEDFSPLFLTGMDGHTDLESGNDSNMELNDKLNAIASIHKLTVREREVMELIYKGYTNPEIGEKLYISINTVKKHTHNVFEKLDAGNRMEVVYLINSWEKK